MNEPLVTISIPTRNSEKFIELCLDAISAQTYKNIEVNLVDANSTDNTVILASKHKTNPKVLKYEHGLLGARKCGLDSGRGKFTLLLDSDQILDSSCIERCISFINKYSYKMLVLEEDVYKNKNWIEKLFHYDRLLIHKIQDLDPNTSVLLPRFYDSNLLKDAMGHITRKSLESISGQDHAIIYHEVWKINKQIGILPNAVLHVEPNNLLTIWKKFYRWGYTSSVARNNEYAKVLSEKERFRKGLFTKGLIIPSLASILLLILKGLPYKIGSLVARIDNNYRDLPKQ